MDIIINDKTNIDLKKLRDYLGIQEGKPTTYSKDAANIATEHFVTLFNGNDYSFSEILDPASEQSDMVNENVQITMLYCYLNEEPIYITLKKEQDTSKGPFDFRLQKWHFCFHRNPNSPGEFIHYNFGIIRSGKIRTTSCSKY